PLTNLNTPPHPANLHTPPHTALTPHTPPPAPAPRPLAPGPWPPAPAFGKFHLPNALISTSTPAGRSSFISASTVCWVGSRMSSRRLCVRISNCSRDFLSTCGDRSTVVMLRDVGRGIGPATVAPVRFAVSTISVVD